MEAHGSIVEDGGVTTPLRIMVVDDNHDAADTLAGLLKMRGYDVRRAYDGRTALLIAAQHRPDLVFLDLIMPKMDGLELAQAIRDLPGLERVQIVAVSGYDDESLRELTRVAGFSGHLVKPATLATLQPVLDASGERSG
jgi:CheY-like chemotaxis protein